MRTKPAVATTAVVLTFLLVGCGGTSAVPEQLATPSTSAAASPTVDTATKVRAWADAGGFDSLDTLVKSLGQVEKDSDPVDLAALQTSCAQLTADVEAIAEEDPMPDDKLAARWKLALDHLGKSASACTVGAASGDQASFDLMAAEMSIGNEHLDAVAKQITEIAES
ncbi:hypothetical protein OHB05_39030 [Streptomyces sp. NBC_00638]|uniref:hypothetical protein n=1 Tax=unclassified Streptomyces TaxID=2593676 RepID=UPI002256AFDC|nr:hypothetical protein [Streptomyces sp. NBC_00638]MCX5008551.1 hypothetical protein [Streptomyces sp. NBC_00638]